MFSSLVFQISLYRMKKQFLSLILLLSGLAALAQDQVATQYAGLITSQDLKANLSILASDALEGRETGKRGQKMAAAFISAYFEDLGLAGPVNGGYQQPVELFTMEAPAVTLAGQTGALEQHKEFSYYGSGQTNGTENFTLLFVGKGTDEELTGLDVKGKAVAVFLDANASMRRNPAITKLREKGASVVLAINDADAEFTELSGMIQSYTGGQVSLSNKPSANLGSLFISPATAGKLFKTTADKLKKAIADKKVAKVKPATLSVSVKQNYSPLKSSNVLGYLEGSDKKDELLVITAHYDHIGIDENAKGDDKINNGADDDGSGTVSVMQIAKAFVEAKKNGKGPRRSILFMLVTGEEKGLLGSDYYTQHPIFPLENTVVNLNIDMVGRRDPQHKDSAPYVYVIGSDRLSAELHSLSETTNNTYTKLLFDYTYNAESHPDRIYYRSDHWNFAKNNIPIIFYFDGIHEDYHQPGDEVEKIEFDLMAQRAKCVFHTAWEIANREGRIKADKK
jgi:hypothetical protein